jgi:hypothetical protein
LTPRSLAGLLLVAAGLLFVTVAIPSTRRAVTLGEEYRRLRQSRREAEQRLGAAERRMAARARAARILAGVSSTPGGDPLAELRTGVLATLDGQGLHKIRLQVRLARAPLAAAFTLGASGSFDQIVDLSGRLASPASGVILEQATFRRVPRGLSLDIRGARPGAVE